jgi:hypothetical protein
MGGDKDELVEGEERQTNSSLITHFLCLFLFHFFSARLNWKLCSRVSSGASKCVIKIKNLRTNCESLAEAEKAQLISLLNRRGLTGMQPRVLLNV